MTIAVWSVRKLLKCDKRYLQVGQRTVIDLVWPRPNVTMRLRLAVAKPEHEQNMTVTFHLFIVWRRLTLNRLNVILMLW